MVAAGPAVLLHRLPPAAARRLRLALHSLKPLIHLQTGGCPGAHLKTAGECDVHALPRTARQRSRSTAHVAASNERAMCCRPPRAAAAPFGPGLAARPSAAPPTGRQSW